MSLLKIGIVGVGGIAVSRHIPALLQLADEVEIIGVYDVNIARAKEVSSQFRITHVFHTMEELFQQADAVVICTPNKFHAEIAIAALEAGCHVLSEKPMAMTSKECMEMITAAKKAQKHLSVAYHYRFMKEAQAAKKIMMAKEIGKPMVVRVQALRRRKVPGWGVFTNKELQGGGSLIDYGCHLLDLSLWLIGNPKATEVTGTTYNALSKTPDQVNEWGQFSHENFEVDDHVTAYLRFENGATMLVEVSWSANIEQDQETVSISGDEGGLNVFPLKVNYAKHGMLFTSKADWIPSVSDPGFEQAKNFVNVCLNREEPIVKWEEALQVSEIIESIYKSNDERKGIQL